MGEIERVAGKFEKARKYFQEANQVFEQLQIGSGKAFFHRGMGDLAQAQGDFKEAFRQFQIAVGISQSISHAWMKSYSLCGLGRAAIGLKLYETADKYFAEAFNIAQRLNNHGLLMTVFSGFASYMIQVGKLEQAVELSSCVIHHFASWNETKQQARRTLDDASRELPREVVVSAIERGKTAVLEDLLSRYLEQK